MVDKVKILFFFLFLVLSNCPPFFFEENAMKGRRPNTSKKGTHQCPELGIQPIEIMGIYWT